MAKSKVRPVSMNPLGLKSTVALVIRVPVPLGSSALSMPITSRFISAPKEARSARKPWVFTLAMLFDCTFMRCCCWIAPTAAL